MSASAVSQYKLDINQHTDAWTDCWLQACHVVLQLLQQAAGDEALQADLVEPVLAMSLQQDARSKNLQMTDRSCNLLTMLKQTAGGAWPEVLQEATASLLAEALLQEPGQPDVTHLFEARIAASLVSSLLLCFAKLPGKDRKLLNHSEPSGNGHSV